MVSEGETKIDIEKLVVWALRKQNCMYATVKPGEAFPISFEFHFIKHTSVPIDYNSIIGDFDTEETPMESDKEPEYIGTFDKQYKSIKAPNNTMLFKHWVEENKIKRFTLQSFVAANPTINKEQAEKIVTHQIHKRTICQVQNNTFKIVKEL
jgi:hypothetical protein